VTREEVMEAFEYRDGQLVWKDYEGSGKSWNRRRRGSVAGHPSGHGYIKLRLKGRGYYVHQLVFLMYHGYIPKVIDHIDGDTQNNRVENLRAADKSKNGMNRSKPRNNTSGVKGVTWHKAAKKWMASVVLEGKSIYLGLYTELEDAAHAAQEARKNYHGDFAKA
jgi:hypothetical protein